MRKNNKKSLKKISKRQKLFDVFGFFQHNLKQSAGFSIIFVIFGAFMFGQAQNSKTPVYRISPTTCSGWQASKSAERIDLLPTANRGAFSVENSAYISNVNVIVSSSTSDNKHQLNDVKPSFICSGFSLPNDMPKDGRLESASLKISLAANGFAESEDVLVLEYSLDGENWQNIDSFATTGQVSNAVHGGYWQVDLANFDLDQISKFQVRADFRTVQSDEVSSVFLDGIGLDISVKERPVLNNLKLPENIVKVGKSVFKATEIPEIAVEVAEKSRLDFLGFDGVKREIEEVKVTDPGGSNFPAEFETSQSVSGRSTFKDYKLKNDNFKKPGKYKITFKIIQDNVEGEVTRDFSWGVLVMNTDKSVYHPGETVKIGMGTLDSQGHTLCDADLQLTVTSPWGEKKNFSTQDKTIITSPECGPTTVTNVPDYSAEYDTGVEGEYIFKLKAVTAEGVNETEERIPVKGVIAFDVSRSGPTRVWPIAEYSMSLNITPQADYQGPVEEYVPLDFAIKKPEPSATILEKDGRKIIRWQVNWQADQTYELKYVFNPPDVSPELFLLGKLKIGDFEEGRKWQIASDIVGTAAFSTDVSGTFQKFEGEGRHMVFTGELIGYAIYVNNSGTLLYQKTINGGIDWYDAVAITAQADVENYAVWYDRWTPGNTGNLIHVAFSENGGDTIYYDNIDTGSSDTQKGEVAVYSDAYAARAAGNDSLSITRATDGDLYVAITANGSGAVQVVRNSSDVGSNWTTTADEGLDDGAVGDFVLLMPLASADILLIRWDVSADDIQSKEYEDGADAWSANWTDNNIDTNAADGARQETWGATIDPVTYNIYLAYVDNAYVAASTPDVRTAVYNGASWTAKTDVVTDINTIVTTSIAYDTSTGDIYVPYVRGTQSANTVYYKVSRDGMATWSVERGPILSSATNQMEVVQVTLAGNDTLGVWTYSTVAGLWYGTIQDVGKLSGALQLTNMNGFESADSIDANATAGTFSYDGTTKRSGEYSLRSNPSAATGYVQHAMTYAADGTEATTAYDVLSSVVAVYVASGTVQNQASIIYDVRSAAASLFTVTLNTDRTIAITGGAGNSTTALAQDTWYVLAITVNADTDIHEVGIYNSDMTVFYESLSSTSALAGASFSLVRLGISTAGTTADVYLDDFMVFGDNVAGNFPMLKGDYHIARMDANAAGTDTAWAGVNCASGDYLCINEIPTSTTNYIRITAVGDETSNLESAASAGITGTLMNLRVVNTVNESSNTVQTMVRAVRIRAGLPDETSRVNTTTTWTDYSKIYNFIQLNPSLLGESTTPYTVSDLDSLQVGVGTDQDPGTGYYQNGDSVIQVAYAPSKVLVSGKIYSDEGSTAYNCSSDNLTIYAATNGGTSRTGLCNSANGTFTIVADAATTAGDPIAIFTDSAETPKATTVTLASDTTSNITGIDMYQNDLVLRHETSSATPMSNAKLATADNTNAGIRYSVATTALTVESGIELHVWTGKTYTAGGTVTTNATGGNFHVDDSAVATLDSGTSSIGLDFLIDGGATLNLNADVTVNGGDITTSGTSATVAHTANTPTVTVASSGSLGGGTTPSLTFYNLTLSGTPTLASDISIKNNLTLPASVTAGSTTVTMTGTGGTIVGGGATLNNLTINPATTGATTLSTSDLTISGTVNVATDDTFNIGSGRTLIHTGSTLTLNGTLSGPGRYTYRSSTAFPTSGTLSGSLILRLDATSNNQTMSNRTDYQLVEIDNSGSTNGRTVTMSASTHTLAGSLTVLSSGTGSVTLVGADNNPTVNVGGALTYTSGGGTKTITTGTGTWTVSGNVNLTNGTFTATTDNTLTMNGSGTSLTTASNQLFNFVANPGASNTITLNDDFTTQVYGDVTISSGTLSSAYNMTVNGGDLTGAGDLNHTANTVTLYTSGVIGSSSTPDWNFNNLTLSIGATGCTLDYATTTGAGSGTMTINGTLTTQSCSCGESCSYKHTLDAGAKSWILAGLTPTSGAMRLIGNTSTFRYTGVNPSGNVTVGYTSSTTTYYYYNLELQASSAETYTLPGDTINVKNNFYVSADTTISADVFSELAMVGPGTIDANGETLHNLKIDPATSGTVTVQNTDVIVANELNVAADDTFTINSGRSVTCAATGPGPIYTLSGSISGPGRLIYQDANTTFPSGGTLASSLILQYDSLNGNQTMRNRTDYQLVEIENSGTTGGRTVTMSAGTHTLAGNLTVQSTGSGGVTLIGATNNPMVNITGNLSFGASNTKTITSGTGVWTVSGDVNFTNGTFTATAGNTLKMNGTSKSLTSASQTLQNFEVSGGSVSSVGALDVNGTFKVSGGGFTQASANNLNVAGNFTLDAATTFTASTSGLLIFDGDLQYTDSTSPQQNIGDLQIGTSPDTTTLTTNLTARTLTVKAGDILITDGYDLDIGGAITVEGTGTLNASDNGGAGGVSLINTEGKFENSGTFTCGTSTLTFDGDPVGATTQNLKTNASPLYNLVINEPTGNELTIELQDALDVDNNLTITSGILDVKSGSNFGITVGGSWANSDVFTARSGIVTFDSTATGKTINAGASSFYAVIFNGAGGAWSPLTSTMTVTGDLTITNGTFNTVTGTADVTVNGNVQCGASCGTITMNSAGTNTFTQSVAADKSFGTNVAVATNWTFYNLTFTGTSGVRTITTNSTGTGQIIVANDLSLSNSGTSLALDNNTNDRILDVNGSVSIGSGTTLSASSSASFTVAKSWTNSGAFTHNSGTVTLDSSNAGTITGSTTFYNLYSSGIGAAKTLTFVHGTTQTVEGTWTAVGSAGNLITLQRDNTSAWTINPTAATVSYVDVSWSTNSGVSFCATYSTDSENNTSWNISTGSSCEPSLSVVLSGSTAALGALSVSNINQAGITSTVTTNAVGGYVSVVKYNSTLTSGSDTIPDASGGTIVAGTSEFGASSSQSGNTITQWSPAACLTTGTTSNATALTTAFQSFASNAGVVTNEATTLCFEASISAITPAGSYSSEATLVTTGTF